MIILYNGVCFYLFIWLSFTLTRDGYTTHYPKSWSFFLFSIFHPSSPTFFFPLWNANNTCSHLVSDTLQFILCTEESELPAVRNTESLHSVSSCQPDRNYIISRIEFLTVNAKRKGRNDRLRLWQHAVVLHWRSSDLVKFTDMINIIPWQAALKSS